MYQFCPSFLIPITICIFDEENHEGILSLVLFDYEKMPKNY